MLTAHINIPMIDKYRHTVDVLYEFVAAKRTMRAVIILLSPEDTVRFKMYGISVILIPFNCSLFSYNLPIGLIVYYYFTVP